MIDAPDGALSRPVLIVRGQANLLDEGARGWRVAQRIDTRLLKRLFDYALTCGVVQANPVLALPMRHVHKAKSRDRALSPAEIGVFLRAAYNSNIRRQFKLALHLTLLTMVRKSELLLARWENVDLEAGEWQIPAEHSKTGKPHIVYLSTQALDIMVALKTCAGNSKY